MSNLKCFTISETTIYEGIFVVDGGIGIDGKLALLADGKSLPKPDISPIPDIFKIPYFQPSPKSMILRGDYFRYSNEKVTCPPIIYSGDFGGAGALVLWIVNLNGINYFSDIWSLRRTKLLLGPIQHNDCLQYLFMMENESADVMVKPEGSVIDLHYHRGILSLNKD